MAAAASKLASPDAAKLSRSFRKSRTKRSAQHRLLSSAWSRLLLTTSTGKRSCVWPLKSAPVSHPMRLPAWKQVFDFLVRKLPKQKSSDGSPLGKTGFSSAPMPPASREHLNSLAKGRSPNLTGSVCDGSELSGPHPQQCQPYVKPHATTRA